MRHIITILLVLASPVLLAQTTFIVDHNFNAPTGTHVFSTIQAAVNAAVAGDIIQIQPSPTAYGSVTINKQLTIMGIGFNLTKDIPLSSTMGNITLTNNPATLADASGTIITGLIMGNFYPGTDSGPNYTLNDVTIHNCRLASIATTSAYMPLNNFLAYGNDITSYVQFGRQLISSVFRNNVLRANYITVSHGTPSTLNITNNIFYAYVAITATGSSVSINNNNFIGGSNTYALGTLYDKLVVNNIFYGRTPSNSAAGAASTSFQRNTFTNNLSISSGNDALPPAGATNTGDGNLAGIPAGFTNVPVSSSWSTAYDFSLLVGTSQAINAGSDGTDIGITGGAYPWTEVNLFLKTSAAPTIETLNTSTIINPNSDLPVRVKAKSN
jgi:hypothetical protein